VLLLAGLLAGVARGDDPDNCLLCHQYRGLGRYDAATGVYHLYAVNPAIDRQHLGPHSRVACTACHRREEVGVVPHQPVTPVNCTQRCHLPSTTDMVREFSHANVADMLTRSVHSPELLAGLSFTGGPLLGAGQSFCLYCHDEPVFRGAGDPGRTVCRVGEHAFDRCDVCHGSQIPTDAPYYLRHVASRLQRARPPLEAAQICAVCHSDPHVIAGRLPDTVASFVRSFHGKAALLGETTTADCVSCHVPAGANAHLMLSRTDPRSATHPNHVADSCRSLDCHPGADVRLAAAAVHLNLSEARGTIEFAVAAAFILLTIFTFGPSLAIALLELGQIVIGRHYPAGHQTLVLTQAVLRHPDGPRRLQRFTVNQRVQHWILAVLFTLLALTGFPMKFADQAWAKSVIDTFGGLSMARTIHHWAGLALVTGLLAHLLYVAGTLLQRWRTRMPDGSRRGLIGTLFDLPMWVSPRDGVKMLLLLGYLAGLRRAPPTFGRFSVKEKFEYIGVFWGTILLGITGIMLWGEQFTSRFVSGRVLNIALIAHTYEAFLAIIHVGILHICNVIFAPNAFPLSLATITGATPVAELAENHSEFVTEAASDLGVEIESDGRHH
jgi:cytochrome b subunit of formate dehydrogenase